MSSSDYDRAWRIIQLRGADYPRGTNPSGYPLDWFSEDGRVNTAHPEAQQEAARLVSEMARERR